MRAAACLECAAARAATRYRSAATVSCTTDLLRRGSAHCTRSADIAATLAVNEWFELEGPRTASLRRRRLLPRVLGSIVSTLSKTGAHRRHLGAHQGKATSRPSRPSGLAYASSPPRARSSRPGVVPGRQRLCPMPQCHRRRSFGPQTSATGGGGGTGTTPGRAPPGRAPLPRGGPRCATVVDLGFRRPACSPLAVVASEPTLGATAYAGGGGAGVRSRSPRGGRVARRPSS